MTLILKQIARLLAALVALYGVLLVISLLLVPRAELGQRLNAARAPSSLFLTEPKYVFLARSQLNNNADKVILVGASNTLAGFRQPQVQALLPGLEVHNLAVGGSNITQIGQVVDLVREVQAPEARRHNTYVFGLWYGLFASDKARWYTPDRQAGDTDIDIERYRYGFYRRTAAGAVAVLPPQHLDVGVLLIHPYLVLDRTARDLTASLREFMAAKPPPITDEQRNAIVLNDAQKSRYLAFWRDYTGQAESLGDAPFRNLERTVDSILAEGGRVVLVDLPIPAWHTQGSVLAADYRRHMNQLLPGLKSRPGVLVMEMDDAGSSDDFSDEVHPKPRVTGRWAQRLADELNADGRQASAAAASGAR
jgi:hypothetical protein